MVKLDSWGIHNIHVVVIVDAMGDWEDETWKNLSFKGCSLCRVQIPINFSYINMSGCPSG